MAETELEPGANGGGGSTVGAGCGEVQARVRAVRAGRGRGAFLDYLKWDAPMCVGSAGEMVR